MCETAEVTVHSLLEVRLDTEVHFPVRSMGAGDTLCGALVYKEMSFRAIGAAN